MNDRKIIFFDIDGTIYHFLGGIPKDTMTSIRQLRENGHIPVICTGRTKIMIYKEFLEPGFDYIIGGAGTYIEEHGKELFYKELDNDTIHEVIKCFRDNGFSPVVEGRDNLYVEYENTYRDKRGNRVIEIYREQIKDHCREIDLEDDIHASKISGCFTKISNPQGIYDALSDRFSIIDHNGDLLELVPKPYSKATGIEELLNRLNIPKENTYAFGDSFNDLEMLQYVQYGIAMGNSDPEMFKYTKYHTADYDKGGITNMLKKFELI